MRWNSAGANGGGSVLSDEANDAWLGHKQMHCRTFTAQRSSGRSIANAYARCRFQGLIRACSLGFCGRRRRIGLTIDAEWRR